LECLTTSHNLILCDFDLCDLSRPTDEFLFVSPAVVGKNLVSVNDRGVDCGILKLEPTGKPASVIKRTSPRESVSPPCWTGSSNPTIDLVRSFNRKRITSRDQLLSVGQFEQLGERFERHVSVI